MAQQALAEIYMTTPKDTVCGGRQCLERDTVEVITLFVCSEACFRLRRIFSEFQVSGFGFRDSISGLQSLGLGFRVSGFQVSGFRVSGFGFRVDRRTCSELAAQ